ncbi:Predicted L-carnitine dehydratase/alpha-methylacyl-CoA racemase [Ceraceosorus bombacis]|uniref:Predicted L-carnitine dehydratase/alpha-methylacyl-CoA racemase n=1 Tax=Ceraceosorus bombacis TaxID=401625 RepID=A0A0P1BCI7_9BASI|nr:Predicted L-carnitine dehydratase/alpha-methylacyl-CoA racemase [Ceraceosorus bombacis]
MTSSRAALPLSGLKVVEFAGLAPGPMVGLILADFGATVIRIDKVNASFNPDSLVRGKKSVALDPKNEQGLRVIRRLLSQTDVVVDPFRPGVLERLGLGPEDVRQGREACGANEGCVFARLTGFQRQGPYASMAGHDINYIALSGLLSMLGNEAGGAPSFPANLLGDFAGGSLICVLGILLALLERSKSGKGQVVESDMVTGARYLSSFLLISSYLSHPEWGSVAADGTEGSRGTGALTGGAPWYAVYKCRDGKWFSVGAIEPPFYAELLRILKESTPSAPTREGHPSVSTQNDRTTWPSLRAYFTSVFSTQTREYWTSKFLGTDACAVPVLTRDESLSAVQPVVAAEIAVSGEPVVPQPAPRLSRTPAIAPKGSEHNVQDESPELLLQPGEHTASVLREWIGVDAAEFERLVECGAASVDLHGALSLAHDTFLVAESGGAVRRDKRAPT